MMLEVFIDGVYLKELSVHSPRLSHVLEDKDVQETLAGRECKRFSSVIIGRKQSMYLSTEPSPFELPEWEEPEDVADGTVDLQKNPWLD